MNIATTRGCPYHCNWCAKPIYGQRYADAQPEGGGRRDRLAQAALRARSPLDRRRHLRAEAGWVEDFAALVHERGRARAVPLPDARRPGDAGRRAGARRAPAAGRCGWAPSRARRGSSTRWRRACASTTSATANRLLQGRGHRGRLLPAVRLSGRDLGRHRSAPCSWCASSSPPTSACRCRIRCRARSSTSASGRSSATSRTGSTRAISPMMYKATYAPEFYRACTGSCTTSSARASPPSALSALARSPWEVRPAHAAARRVVDLQPHGAGDDPPPPAEPSR